MNDELLVGIDEYKILNEENPIAYTRDITSCIICLAHRNNDSVLMHIESYENAIMLDNFIALLSEHKNNPIKYIELFKGKNTSIGNLSIINFLLHRVNVPYELYDVFTNSSNETSIGYNYNTKEHYMVRMNKGKPILTKKNLN